jgi:hypothetical protein
MVAMVEDGDKVGSCATGRLPNSRPVAAAWAGDQHPHQHPVSERIACSCWHCWQNLDFFEKNIYFKAKFGIACLPARIDIR